MPPPPPPPSPWVRFKCFQFAPLCFSFFIMSLSSPNSYISPIFLAVFVFFLLSLILLKIVKKLINEMLFFLFVPCLFILSCIFVCFTVWIVIMKIKILKNNKYLNITIQHTRLDLERSLRYEMVSYFCFTVIEQQRKNIRFTKHGMEKYFFFNIFKDKFYSSNDCELIYSANFLSEWFTVICLTRKNSEKRIRVLKKFGSVT